MIFLADIFFLFLKPKYISTKDKIAKVGPAGKVKIEDITGCHKNPEQFKISKDEHGSIYLLTMASVICKLSKLM